MKLKFVGQEKHLISLQIHWYCVIRHNHHDDDLSHNYIPLVVAESCLQQPVVLQLVQRRQTEPLSGSHQSTLNAAIISSYTLNMAGQVWEQTVSKTVQILHVSLVNSHQPEISQWLQWTVQEVPGSNCAAVFFTKPLWAWAAHLLRYLGRLSLVPSMGS